MASKPALFAAVLMSGSTLVAAPPTLANDTPATAEANVSRAEQRPQGAVSRAERASRARASLVRVALTKKGSRYVSGAPGPYSFDCSGFTMWVYKKATGKSLPHYSGAQMQRAKRVSLSNLLPGDLLFYGAGGSQHVSMYIGKGKMIHATNPRTGVKIDSINAGYYRARFAGAGRIIAA
jgi:cell wall-associated NlpC family hydrolase